MKPLYTIYRLIDPRDSKPFYVGRTTDVKQRKHSHGWIVRPSSHSTSQRLRTRISELASEGLKPIMAVIEETNDKSRETYWIEHLTRLGVQLLNKHGIRHARNQGLYGK